MRCFHPDAQQLPKAQVYLVMCVSMDAHSLARKLSPQKYPFSKGLATVSLGREEEPSVPAGHPRGGRSGPLCAKSLHRAGKY